MHASLCLGASASWIHAIAVIDADLGTPRKTTELGDGMEHAVLWVVCSMMEACTGCTGIMVWFIAAPDELKENMVPDWTRPCRMGSS